MYQSSTLFQVATVVVSALMAIVIIAIILE